jgi:hypothetical protein
VSLSKELLKIKKTNALIKNLLFQNKSHPKLLLGHSRKKNCKLPNKQLQIKVRLMDCQSVSSSKSACLIGVTP